MKRVLRYALRKLRRLAEDYGIPELVEHQRPTIVAEYRRCRQLGMSEENAVIRACIAGLKHAV